MTKKIILSCFAGNVLEWYEFAIFGYLTPYLSELFFPSHDPITSIILTYGVFATGFIMRPMGAIFSGYIGDKYGRKLSLIISILMMMIPTTLMGLLPTYNQIGLLAPLLLLGCRLVQGLSLGGEFSSSIIYLIENAPVQRRGFFGSWADLGSSVGMILATLTSLGLTCLLAKEDILSWGWRIPFLFGLGIGGIGLIMRRHLNETPIFLEAAGAKIQNPLKEAILNDPLKFFFSITFLAINASGYYFLIIYLPREAGHGLSLYLSLSSLLIMMPATFLGAYFSDKVGQFKCLISGIISAGLLVIPTIYSTYYLSTAWIFVFHGLFSASLGLCFGPRSSFIVQLYPVHLRCSGVSVSYNLANAIFGGTAPLLSMLSVQIAGTKLAPGFLILALSFLSLISVIKLNQKRKILEKTS